MQVPAKPKLLASSSVPEDLLLGPVPPRPRLRLRDSKTSLNPAWNTQFAQLCGDSLLEPLIIADDTNWVFLSEIDEDDEYALGIPADDGSSLKPLLVDDTSYSLDPSYLTSIQDLDDGDSATDNAAAAAALNASKNLANDVDFSPGFHFVNYSFDDDTDDSDTDDSDVQPEAGDFYYVDGDSEEYECSAAFGLGAESMSLTLADNGSVNDSKEFAFGYEAEDDSDADDDYDANDDSEADDGDDANGEFVNESLLPMALRSSCQCMHPPSGPRMDDTIYRVN